MLNCKLDHLVVAATTLEQGAEYVEQVLGVRVPNGGQHEMMGTHNKVMTLGGGSYLEIIAINPEMTPPSRPRWFGLDDPSVQHSLATSPRLLTWAINTSDLDQLVQQSQLVVGEPQQASRNDLRWKVALTDDGRLSAGGFFPLCIEWQMDFHPSERMADLDCQFEKLVIYHPYPVWLESVLTDIGAAGCVEIHPIGNGQSARMDAVIATPMGTRLLTSQPQ